MSVHISIQITKKTLKMSTSGQYIRENSTQFETKSFLNSTKDFPILCDVKDLKANKSNPIKSGCMNQTVQTAAKTTV